MLVWLSPYPPSPFLITGASKGVYSSSLVRMYCIHIRKSIAPSLALSHTRAETLPKCAITICLRLTHALSMRSNSSTYLVYYVSCKYIPQTKNGKSAKKGFLKSFFYSFAMKAFHRSLLLRTIPSRFPLGTRSKNPLTCDARPPGKKAYIFTLEKKSHFWCNTL